MGFKIFKLSELMICGVWLYHTALVELWIDLTKFKVTKCLKSCLDAERIYSFPLHEWTMCNTHTHAHTNTQTGLPSVCLPL